MSFLLEFMNVMFGRDSKSRLSSSPSSSSSFLQRAVRTFRSSPATMPMLIKNSLQDSPTSSCVTQTFSRLDSTGETIETDVQSERMPAESIPSSSFFGQCVLPHHEVIHHHQPSNFSCTTMRAMYPVTRKAKSLSPTEKSVPWLCYSPSSTAVSKPTIVPQTGSVRSSQSMFCTSTTTTDTANAMTNVAPRMVSSCDSMSCSKALGPRLTGNLSSSPSSQSQLHLPSPQCSSSPKKHPDHHAVYTTKPTPEKPTAEQHRRYRLTMHMSSADSETDNQKSSPTPCMKDPSAMAQVNVQVQFATPPCSHRSRKKKSRPSAKKRRRSHQKRDEARSKNMAPFESASDHTNPSPQKRKTTHSSCSNSIQSPQSFTVTFLDISSHNSSLDSAKSPPHNAMNDHSCSKFSFHIRPDSESESDSGKEDEEKEVGGAERAKDSKSPSMCSKLLSVIQSSDYETESSATGSDVEDEDDHEDDDWDEEDEVDSGSGAKEDLWESFSNQGLVNFSFTCSITPTKLPECPLPTETEEAGESDETEAAKEAKAANQRWNEAYGAVATESPKPPQVCFPSERRRLTYVHVMHTWDFAYRAARPGLWARDAERFHKRIADVGAAIGHVFEEQHRARVYVERIQAEE